jgi:hypothetical protein
MEIPIDSQEKDKQKDKSISYNQVNSTVGLIGKSSLDVLSSLNKPRLDILDLNALMASDLVKGNKSDNNSFNKSNPPQEAKTLQPQSIENVFKNKFNNFSQPMLDTKIPSKIELNSQRSKLSAREKVLKATERMHVYVDHYLKDEIEIKDSDNHNKDSKTFKEIELKQLKDLKESQHSDYNSSKRQYTLTNKQDYSIDRTEKKSESFVKNNHSSRVDKKEIIIKRKSIIEKRRMSRKRVSDINTFAVTDMLKKSQSKSQYSRILSVIKWLDLVIAFIITLNILVSIIDNEISLNYSDDYLAERIKGKPINYILTLPDLEYLGTRQLKPIENFLRFINIFLSFIISGLIIWHYRKLIELEQIEWKLSQYDSLWTSGKFKYLVIDIFISLIFYPPYLNIFITGEMLGLIYAYNCNSVFSVLVMTKLYFVVRIYKYFSHWTNNTAVAICNNYNVKSGIHFAVKAEMKKRPGTILSILLIISLIFLGFSLRTFEYKVIHPIYGLQGVKGINDLQNLFNCLWLVIVTMTTVGYGDFYPRSHLGRLVGVISCIVGMLLLSLIVVFLGSMSEFSPEEKKAFSKLKKLFASDNVENKAANVIKNIFFLNRLRFQNKKKSKRVFLMEMFFYLTSLRKEISIFKNDYKIANSYSLPVDEMLLRLEVKLKDDIIKLSDILSQINGTDKDLDLLSKDQEEIQSTMTGVIKMQEDISKYMVNLNNQKYLENVSKNNSPYISFGNYKRRRSKGSLTCKNNDSMTNFIKKKTISFGVVDKNRSDRRKSSSTSKHNINLDQNSNIPKINFILEPEEDEIQFKNKIKNRFLGYTDRSSNREGSNRSGRNRPISEKTEENEKLSNQENLNCYDVKTDEIKRKSSE